MDQWKKVRNCSNFNSARDIAVSSGQNYQK